MVRVGWATGEGLRVISIARGTHELVTRVIFRRALWTCMFVRAAFVALLLVDASCADVAKFCAAETDNDVVFPLDVSVYTTLFVVDDCGLHFDQDLGFIRTGAFG